MTAEENAKRSSEETVRLAVQKAREGRRDEARQLLEQVDEAWESSPGTQGKGAATADKLLKRLNDAEWYNQSLASAPEAAEVDAKQRQLKIARGYFDIGDLENAEKQIEELMERLPNDEAALATLADIDAASAQFSIPSKDQTRAKTAQQWKEKLETGEGEPLPDDGLGAVSGGIAGKADAAGEVRFGDFFRRTAKPLYANEGKVEINGTIAADESPAEDLLDAVENQVAQLEGKETRLGRVLGNKTLDGKLADSYGVVDLSVEQPEWLKESAEIAGEEQGRTRSTGRESMRSAQRLGEQTVLGGITVQPESASGGEATELYAENAREYRERPDEMNHYKSFLAAPQEGVDGEAAVTVAAVANAEPDQASAAALDLEIATNQEPFSTFSLNVSDVSFKLAAAAFLENGAWPDPARIRPEEFVNAFDYGDPQPASGEAVASLTEQCRHPFLPGRNLLRVSMRTAAAGRSSSTPLSLTVLLDKSGSMERDDREASVLKAMAALSEQLTDGDVVSVIGFARTPSLIVDRLSGAEADGLTRLVAEAPSDGGTNLEEALVLARETAERQFQEGAQNRVVLITDGAANLGDAQPESLQQKVIGLRGAGVAFDACGVGADGLNDEILEALTRKGDGRYYFLDRPQDADAGFVRQLAGALRPAARNVKVQVKFNPGRVSSYRLSGFEKHRLNKEDFRNDKVDAAELAAAESGNAIYQIEVDPAGQGDVGEVFVRFQDMASGLMVERSWRIPYEASAPDLESASPSMRLAALASMFAEKLKGGPLGELIELSDLASATAGLRSLPNERVGTFVQMFEKARQLQP